MRIDFIEIRNFRRLASVRIDFSETTTLFVGANNSGKTSAITALRFFLKQRSPFSVYDIPLANWKPINELGEAFLGDENIELPYEWNELLPSLDIWLKIKEDEIHHVANIIPTLDWNPEEGIGIRLQVEPEKSEELLKAYIKAKNEANEKLCAQQPNGTQDQGTGQVKEKICKGFALWPKNLIDYLKKRMELLKLNAYLLDPSKKALPSNGMAQPQKLSDDSEPLEENPLKSLIKIDEEPAQRGLSDYGGRRGDGDESYQEQLLTYQLRAYYGKHLDPLKSPDPSDIKALLAIHEAQNAFDERLRDCFKIPLDELEGLGYPGIANPRLVISTSLKPIEGLKHQSAVQYDVASALNKSGTSHRLPEQCNGLGYQNLISMVFRLISFRDDWMKVGKAARTDDEKGEQQISPPPIHLVLLEEPEAHLHVQVQQVFIRKAYEVLRNHPNLKDNNSLWTQLVISTHSSHIAHEVDFANMRYFRRHPACKKGETPTSTIVNLSEVFGTPDETARFVSRYLKAMHADLFFADGAIMMEGASERILIPQFIQNNFEALHSCYITLLEVGGSHAHRLKGLIEHLGLNTLIITDIDAIKNIPNHPKIRPQKGVGLLTGNNVLQKWHPKKEILDELLDLKEEEKEKTYDTFAIRVAYQTELKVAVEKAGDLEDVFPRTFEDALALQNIEFFRNAKGYGLIAKFRNAIKANKNISGLHNALLEALGTATKAEFALDILYSESPESIRVPDYIQNGLAWLQDKLLQRQQEIVELQDKDAEAPGEVKNDGKSSSHP